MHIQSMGIFFEEVVLPYNVLSQGHDTSTGPPAHVVSDAVVQGAGAISSAAPMPIAPFVCVFFSIACRNPPSFGRVYQNCPRLASWVVGAGLRLTRRRRVELAHPKYEIHSMDFQGSRDLSPGT